MLDNIRAYAETGVDFISVGALTHSARAADISMTITAEPGQGSPRWAASLRGTGFDFGNELNAQIHAATRVMYDLAALESALADTLFAGKLHFARVTGSTNADAIAAARARSMARRTAPSTSPTSKRPAVAAAITAGISAAGEGLYVSVLLRPQIPAARLPLLPLAAGLAAAPMPFAPSPASLSICAGPTICSSARAKPAAFSSRRRQNPKGCPTQWSLGIGINVHQREFPSDLATPATSLDLEAGRAISRQALLVALLKSLERETLRACRSGGAKDDSRARGACVNLDARPQRRGARPASLHGRHGRPRRTRISARQQPQADWLLCRPAACAKNQLLAASF